MNGAADSREVSCKTPRGSNRSSEAQKARSVLTFVQWRARLLLPVDRRFLLFVLVALVVYDYQTPHRLSFRTSDSSAIAHERVMGWLVVPEPECSTGVAPSKVADLLLRASMLRQVLHHVATSTMVRIHPQSHYQTSDLNFLTQGRNSQCTGTLQPSTVLALLTQVHSHHRTG